MLVFALVDSLALFFGLDFALIDFPVFPEAATAATAATAAAVAMEVASFETEAGGYNEPASIWCLRRVAIRCSEFR
jgi:hypothetical protein